MQCSKVRRADIRQSGYEGILEALRSTRYLSTPVHYMCLAGSLGAGAWPVTGTEVSNGCVQPLDWVPLAPPTRRAALLLAHSRLASWTADEIRALSVLNAPSYALYDDLNENSPRAR